MNWAPADFIREAHTKALENVATNHYQVRFASFDFLPIPLLTQFFGLVQLPRGSAHLRQALSKYLSESFKRGRDLDPNTEIQVTAGANEGDYDAAMMVSCEHELTYINAKQECTHSRVPSLDRETKSSFSNREFPPTFGEPF